MLLCFFIRLTTLPQEMPGSNNNSTTGNIRASNTKKEGNTIRYSRNGNNDDNMATTSENNVKFKSII